MRRRERSPIEVPAELATFDEAAWEGRGGIHGWMEARLSWGKENDWPVDPVAMLKEHRKIKRRLARRGGLPEDNGHHGGGS